LSVRAFFSAIAAHRHVVEIDPTGSEPEAVFILFEAVQIIFSSLWEFELDKLSSAKVFKRRTHSILFGKKEEVMFESKIRL
jgi:hypothetical protein